MGSASHGRATDEPLLDRVAGGFAAIASRIRAGQPESALEEALTQTQAWCVQAAACEDDAPAKGLLTNVQQALRTWREVWPRLGAQEEFRGAVAREAALWSRRFGELAAGVRPRQAPGCGGAGDASRARGLRRQIE